MTWGCSLSVWLSHLFNSLSFIVHKEERKMYEIHGGNSVRTYAASTTRQPLLHAQIMPFIFPGYLGKRICNGACIGNSGGAVGRSLPSLILFSHGGYASPEQVVQPQFRSRVLRRAGTLHLRCWLVTTPPPHQIRDACRRRSSSSPLSENWLTFKKI